MNFGMQMMKPFVWDDLRPGMLFSVGTYNSLARWTEEANLYIITKVFFVNENNRLQETPEADSRIFGIQAYCITNKSQKQFLKVSYYKSTIKKHFRILS